jgi:ornithine decarboxylase
MKLTKDIIKITKSYKTPFLIVDPKIIKENYWRIKRSIERVEVYYAIKANPDLRILKILRNLNCGFEVASVNELKLLLKINVNPSLIISSNPIKIPEFIKYAYRNKIRLFAFDSKMEIEKLAKFAPGSRVYPRLNVSNIGSDWPLSGKFGLEFEKIIPLLKYAKKKGLIPYGLTFHVGSQCREKANWVRALKQCYQIFKLAEKEKLNLKMINLGGGLPVKYTEKTPTIEQIGKEISKTIKKLFDFRVKVIIEPGRAMVGNAAILVSSVIGKAKRRSGEWLYLDTGVFNGLMETMGGIKYRVQTEKRGNLKKYILAGPSCDSFDKMFSCYLPANLEIGDRLYIMDAGAYTTAYVSEFDGFEIPKIYFLH